jgi:hypothetical protein
LVVEELRFEFFDVGNFQFVTTLEGSIQYGVSDKVFEFALVERIALSGFDKVDFGQQIGFSVDLDFQAFSQVAGFVGGHSFSVF